MDEEQSRVYLLGAARARDNPFTGQQQPANPLVGQQTVSPLGGQRKGNPFIFRQEPQL